MFPRPLLVALDTRVRFLSWYSLSLPVRRATVRRGRRDSFPAKGRSPLPTIPLLNLNEQTLPVLMIQVFGLFRDFGDPARMGSGDLIRPIALRQFRALLKLEGNSATNRTTTCTELSKYLSVIDVGLEIEQVARINHRFST